MAERGGTAWTDDAQAIRLGDFEIDLRYRTVARAGVLHELNPRCFELLLLFLREPRKLHTRDAIFAQLWAGVIVEDANLTSCVWMLRRALGGEAKQWIRTVSKQGYIFDPPAGVAAVARTVDADPPAPVPIAEETARALPPPRAQRTGWRYALSGAFALLAVMLGAAALRVGGSAAATPRITLIAASDWSEGADTAWPARLLQAWLDWQLRGTSAVAVADPQEPGAADRELAVLLAVTAPTQRDDEWQVSARFRGAAAPADISRRSSGERLVATIDEVSREVFAALAPGAPRLGYPDLPIDAGTAREFIEALADEQQFRWHDAIKRYTKVAEKAPDFGFARVRLARCLSELGEVGAAQAEFGRAQTWIKALPAALRRPLEAQELLLRQDYPAAATAYAALRSDGDTLAYRLAEAHSLRHIGRSGDAAQRLDGRGPSAPADAVQWLLARAEAGADNRDLACAITSATHAMELSRSHGWRHPQARAALLLAELGGRNGEAGDEALATIAANAFDEAGDTLGALRARAFGGLLHAPSGGAAPLDELLAEARQAGNASVEIDALRQAAALYYRAGDIPRVRGLLAQAAAVAESSGNAYERHLLDQELLREDTLHLDFAAVERRLARLRSEPLQGGMVDLVGVNTARMQYLHGDFPAALTTLAQTEDALRDRGTGAMPHIAARFSCMRIGVHMVRGETAAARTDIHDCRAAPLPAYYAHFADVAAAELAIHAGNPAEARRLLAGMRGLLSAPQAEPERWSLVMEMAPLLARIGELDEASRLLGGMLPAVSRSGYLIFEANAHITLAEIALAQGRPDDAEREARAGENLVPADYWYERRRLRTVQAMVEQARGQRERAAQTLTTLHADARERGDVLGELLAHSLMGAEFASAECPVERRERLLAQSGLRGASDSWMRPNARELRVSMLERRE